MIEIYLRQWSGTGLEVGNRNTVLQIHEGVMTGEQVKNRKQNTGTGGWETKA